LNEPRERDLRWDEFERVDMRVGRIAEAEDFPEAHRPAWKLRVDFGPEIGERAGLLQQRRAPLKRGDGLAQELDLIVLGAQQRLGAEPPTCQYREARSRA